MRNTDIAELKRMFQLKDPIIALALLSRLPMPYAPSAARAPASAAWAYPLVGLVVGLIAAGVGWGMQTLGVAAPITAMFVLLASIVVTGAMHEDGLADCADGFWGGWTVERRLEIMKDSTVGTYGVIALAASLVLHWCVLTQLIDKGVLLPAVLTAGVMSRGAMVWVMYRLQHARKNGLSAQTGRPATPTMLIALAISGIAALIAPEVSALWLIIIAAIVTTLVGWIAKRKIGGQTGDVLGATQQLVQITILIAFDVMVP